MPSWKDLKRFCERDDWDLTKQTDHFFFEKTMPDGTIKRTKVSMSPSEIGHILWKRILKQQLQVSQEYFNGKS